ncbi:MAG: HEAT repeat domain-containing protein [Kofleriaceae bacterium]
MKVSIAHAAVVLGLSVGLSASSRGDVPELSLEVEHLLTSMDSMPTLAQLEQTLTGDAEQQLLDIATTYHQWDVRVRAVRALGLFPPSQRVRDALKGLMLQTSAVHDGPMVFLVIAAAETLGALRNEGDVGPVATLLNDPSRDVRISAARALRSIGGASSVDALRARQNAENVPSVRLAISEAIQAIGESR